MVPILLPLPIGQSKCFTSLCDFCSCFGDFGTSFGSVTVTAYDVNNYVKTDYVGLIYFQSSDAGATLPYTSSSKYTFQAGDNGAHTFSGFTLLHGPSQTLTVTDGSISATSSAITVIHDLDHFVFSAPDQRQLAQLSR